MMLWEEKNPSPEDGKIVSELAEIAFSAEEKTADRLRALGQLSDALKAGENVDDALKKLDEVLSEL